MRFDRYESPLSSRYASKEISWIFSPQFKHQTWRRLWVALAKAEKELGLNISDQQIQALEQKISDIDFDKAAAYEKEFHHDVMAHIHTYADACPEARSIIHLGATSCFVTDNTELIQMQEGLKILKSKCIKLIQELATFAQKHAALATLSYTHFQPAQPTTVGKRACLWLQDFLTDLKDLDQHLLSFRFLGLKGATGTQASFLSLFNGDEKKVVQLEKRVAQEMGFEKLFTITGQTYPRKVDLRILNTLSSLGASAHKFATDLRLLAHLKEMEEPFEKKQVGSSAMPYKRNPILSERICGLARTLISLAENPAYTAATQWLERSLDDSANRRLSIPEAFLTADALLNLLIQIVSNLVVYPKVIAEHLREELPYFATENLLMAAAQKGKDRQAVHERLRLHTQEAARALKIEGKKVSLVEMISKDPEIGLTRTEIEKLMEESLFTGRAETQVKEFLSKEVSQLS